MKLRRWHKALLLSAAIVLALVAVSAVLVIRNWPTLAHYYRKAAAGLSEVLRVQAAVQTRFGGTVGVMAKWVGGYEGTILSITVENPPWIQELTTGGTAADAKAREIAAAAREALSVKDGYKRFDVAIVHQRGVGVTFTRSWTFSFNLSELSPPEKNDRQIRR